MSRRVARAALSAPIFALAAATPASAAIAPSEGVTSGADDMRLAYWVMLVVTVLLSLALIAGLLMAARRFRAKEGAAEPRRLSAGRGVIAKIGAGLTVLALALFVFGIVASDGVNEATAEDGAEEIDIDAIGQQWLWRFEYPRQVEGPFSEGIATVFSYGELVVPVDTVVNLNIDSTDVIHSWFVPELGPQVWAVPGEVQETSFRAEEEGTYESISTVFSGSGYPTMRATVRVVSAEEYESYLDDLTADLQEGQAAVAEANETEIASEDSQTTDTDPDSGETGE
jgi:cytochrome c oxidase subunit II